MLLSAATVVAILSVSFTLRPPSPSKRLLPFASAAIRHKTGISSSISALWLCDTLKGFKTLLRIVKSPTFSPQTIFASDTDISAPLSVKTVKNSVRVGFSKTFLSVIPPFAIPNATRFAAVEKSFATVRSIDFNAEGLIVTFPPQVCMSAPNNDNIISVWLRVVIFSITVVAPCANNPAKSNALFTCADGFLRLNSLPRKPLFFLILNKQPCSKTTFAPIALNSSATFCIGRRDKLWSPINVASTLSPATTPAKRRAVVALFLQSKTTSFVAFLIGRIIVLPTRNSNDAPSAVKQSAVAKVSALSPALYTVQPQSLNAPQIKALCVTDLSPKPTSIVSIFRAGFTNTF